MHSIQIVKWLPLFNIKASNTDKRIKTMLIKIISMILWQLAIHGCTHLTIVWTQCKVMGKDQASEIKKKRLSPTLSVELNGFTKVVSTGCCILWTKLSPNGCTKVVSCEFAHWNDARLARWPERGSWIWAKSSLWQTWEPWSHMAKQSWKPWRNDGFL